MFKDSDAKALTLQKAVDLANGSISREGNCMKESYLAPARKYCQYIYGADSAKCNETQADDCQNQESHIDQP